MIITDKNTKKVLKIINCSPDNTDIDLIKTKSKIPDDDFLEIMDYLISNEYVRIVHNGYVGSNNKGKTYFSVEYRNWISKNIIAILALIVSIFAFIESTISLILSLSK